MHELETRQLVARSRSRMDRRELQLALTAQGVALAGRIPAVMQDAERVLLRVLHDDECRFLSAFLFAHCEQLQSAHRMSGGTADGELPGPLHRWFAGEPMPIRVANESSEGVRRALLAPDPVESRAAREGQYRFGVWWELHAVHHSQQQTSLWADECNPFLDDIIQAAFFAAIS